MKILGGEHQARPLASALLGREILTSKSSRTPLPLVDRAYEDDPTRQLALDFGGLPSCYSAQPAWNRGNTTACSNADSRVFGISSPVSINLTSCPSPSFTPVVAGFSVFRAPSANDILRQDDAE